MEHIIGRLIIIVKWVLNKQNCFVPTRLAKVQNKKSTLRIKVFYVTKEQVLFFPKIKVFNSQFQKQNFAMVKIGASIYLLLQITIIN
jgi:hypothetical protein